jgi:hypothetical protein
LLAGGFHNCDLPTQLLQVEAVPERSDFLGQRLGAERNGFPVEAVSRQRKDVALLVPGGGKQNQRLVWSQQRLNFLPGQRQRVRQGSIVGKFPSQCLLQRIALGGNDRKPLPDPPLGGQIALGGLIRDSRKN